MIHSGLVDDVVGSVFNKFALGTLSIVYYRNEYILGLLCQYTFRHDPFMLVFIFLTT